MLRFVARVLLLCLIALVPAASGASETMWQVVLRYDETGMFADSAEPIRQMRKKVQSPGLAGAPGTIGCEATWLGQGRSILHQTDLELPIGQRSAPTGDSPCEMFVPAAGIIVVRLAGPPPDQQPAELQLRRTDRSSLSRVAGKIPQVLSRSNWSMTLPPRTEPSTRTLQGPVAVTKIRDTGPDDNRLVVVVLGDGYTQATLATNRFVNDAAGLESSFIGKAPWETYFGAVNIYRIDIESNEDGSDLEDSTNGINGTFRDTYLNSSFWVSGIERLVAIDNTGASRAINAADTLIGGGVWDSMFVIVNSTKYGGSGGFISVVSRNSSADEVIIHEFGHTFANLADEYETPYPGFPPGDPEANVDFDGSGPALKWLAWVDAGVPLPTPETSTYVNKIGAFEGARYLSSGIYRPHQHCLMRELGPQFCNVCKEAHAIKFMESVDIVDEFTPANAGTITLSNSGTTTFSVTPIDVAPLAYVWDIDGEVITGQSGPSVEIDNTFLSGGVQTLKCTVGHPTTYVRQQELEGSVSWSVQPGGPAQSSSGWELY